MTTMAADLDQQNATEEAPETALEPTQEEPEEGADESDDGPEIWVVVYTNGSEKKILHPEKQTTEDVFKNYLEASKKGHHFALGNWLIDTRTVVSFGLLSQEVEDDDGVEEVAEDLEALRQEFAEFKEDTTENLGLALTKVAEHESILQEEMEEEEPEEEYEPEPVPQPKPLKLGKKTSGKTPFKPTRG